MMTENKIVSMFIKNKEPKTIREISKNISSNYKITHTATTRLIKKNILNSKTIGKSTLCELNTKYFGIEIYQAESKRKYEILRNKNINLLHQEIIKNANSHLFILLIFGSYASGKNTKSSDIDLLFISNNNQFEQRISQTLALLPLKIHALFFNESEFKLMKDSKENNVIKEALSNHIILHNIEGFYMIKNA